MKHKRSIKNVLKSQIKTIKENDISIQYKEELKFDDSSPNYAEKLSINGSDFDQKLKCGYINENSNPYTKKLKVIILNDKNKENPKNYIKNNYNFKNNENYKNLVDKLVLSRKDIYGNKYQQLNHDLEDYNLYAEIIDTFNCQIINENEIDSIRKQFEGININIDSEISKFIEFCFNLIVEYLKFELIKEVKFNQCQKCGTKCAYILFSKEQKKIVEESKPTNDELKKGINIVENISNLDILNLNVNESESDNNNLVINVIYLNNQLNKKDLELIEKNISGTLLYLQNITQLKPLLDEINQKNKLNKLNYKFVLICTGKFSGDVIGFLVKEENKIFQDIISNVVIYCFDIQKYLNLKEKYLFVDDVINQSKSLEEYLKKHKKNSILYKTFPIINYSSYSKIHNKLHKEIAKYYGKVAYSYKNAINMFKEFLNEYEDELKIKTGDSTKEGKKKALIETLEVFSTSNEEKKVKIYTKELNSYYQDFNNWLNNINKKAISKIAYFVSSFMFGLNNINRGVKEKVILYRGICIEFSNVIKYYMNYISDDNIITFPSFTSTSSNEYTCKSFINSHKTQNNYGVLFKINYNYNDKIWEYLTINISSISEYQNEDERLFLPFTFYKIKNFELNIENRLAKIELDCIFKKEILEEKLNEKNNVIYNKKDNIMELDNKIIIEDEKFLIDDNEDKKALENSNEISLKIKIEQSDVGRVIYFLDNSCGTYLENNNDVAHRHDNLSEMNENNTTLIIDGKIVSFKKYFIPENSGIYSIKLLLKDKLTDCAYMFCECNKIIDIDFSKFNTENVINMAYMFGGDGYNGCSSLKSLDLSSFNTQKVTNMRKMFYYCSSLTILNLSSFNTKNVTNMSFMFSGCSSLTSFDLSTFNTQNVTNMRKMFYNCSSLITLNLSSFITKKVKNMSEMFNSCKSLTSLDIRNFNVYNADTSKMFDNCIKLSRCNSTDKKIVNAFKIRSK